MTAARRVFRTSMPVLHVVSSLGWLGAVAAFLALLLVDIGMQGRQTTSLAAAAVIVWWVVLPLALASLATGIASCLLSPWGLLRHYWVVTKLVLTAVATIVLVLQMPTVSAPSGDRRSRRSS